MFPVTLSCSFVEAVEQLDANLVRLTIRFTRAARWPMSAARGVGCNRRLDGSTPS
jgi:hypothetical protein